MEMLSRKERGPVLLTVRVHSPRWTRFLWVASVVVIGLMASIPLLKPRGWRTHFPSIPFILIYLSQAYDYLFHPWIKFREGGVEIPPDRDFRRAKFMRWSQIHRWSWDGDRLILTGAYSRGGSARIPETERLAVEQLLGAKLAH